MQPRLSKVALVLAAVSLVAVGPALAKSDDGGGDTSSGAGHDRAEVRRTVRCSFSSMAELKVKPEHGLLKIELEVDGPRAGVAWRVVLLHERSIVLRRLARTTPPSGSFEVRSTVRDWEGTEAITARATALSGEMCRVKVVL